MINLHNFYLVVNWIFNAPKNRTEHCNLIIHPKIIKLVILEIDGTQKYTSLFVNIFGIYPLFRNTIQ